MSATIDDRFAISGEEITFDDAEGIRARGNEMIAAAVGDIEIDLSGLERANSVTVAILMDWFRNATLQQKSIACVSLSVELRNIVEFSGLSEVLLD